jgi:hypothetical protein
MEILLGYLAADGIKVIVNKRQFSFPTGGSTNNNNNNNIIIY